MRTSFSEGVSVVSLNSRMKTLPGGEAAIQSFFWLPPYLRLKELSRFSALLDELFQQTILAHVLVHLTS
jgi:hypothetical protein